MTTHVIRITEVDHDPEYGHPYDEIAWEVIDCPGCHLWQECYDCGPGETLEYDDFLDADGEEIVRHGKAHRWEEGCWVIDIPGCGLVLMDGGIEAVQDVLWAEQQKGRAFQVGERIDLATDYEGDGYWSAWIAT